MDQECLILEVNFDGKRDAALSLKYNMLEVMYELRQHCRMVDATSPEEVEYIRKISQQPEVSSNYDKKVVLVYEQEEPIQPFQASEVIYKDEELKQGALYANLCQAKIRDFSIASLGSLMETLHISQQGQISTRDKHRLFDQSSREVDIAELLLHDMDSKSFIQGKNGKLYYQDLEKGKLIN